MILKIQNPSENDGIRCGWVFIDHIFECQVRHVAEGSEKMKVFWGARRSATYESGRGLEDPAPHFICVTCTFDNGREDEDYNVATASYLLADSGKTVEKLF